MIPRHQSIYILRGAQRPGHVKKARRGLQPRRKLMSSKRLSTSERMTHNEGQPRKEKNMIKCCERQAVIAAIDQSNRKME